jgi:hypothetical protein
MKFILFPIESCAKDLRCQFYEYTPLREASLIWINEKKLLWIS